jgi:transcriptional regulator with XRE-family HTH domain
MTEIARGKLKTYLKGSSQNRLAKDIGTSQGYIWQIVHGQRTPSDDFKVKLAKATGDSPSFSDWEPAVPEVQLGRGSAQ